MIRRRKPARLVSPQQNLDSFLDILTNTVGVLMFIGLFVALLAVDSGNIIRTPLVSNSPKAAQFFEVRNNQVFYLENSRVEQQLTGLIEQLPDCVEPEIPEIPDVNRFDLYALQLQDYEQCQRSRLNQLQGYQVTTTYYQAYFDVSALVTIYQPRSDITGNSIPQLSDRQSPYQQTLQALNPQTHYLAFLVRPDSFAAFRQARKVAWERGFDVGWEPLPENQAIAFGSQGRSIGIQ